VSCSLEAHIALISLFLNDFQIPRSSFIFFTAVLAGFSASHHALVFISLLHFTFRSRRCC
jgi:hypothetical protein